MSQYRSYPTVTTLSDDTPIWRYMSLTQFMSMIYKKALFFSTVKSLKKFEPFEGSLTLDEQFIGSKTRINGELDKRTNLWLQREKQEIINECMLVNCWHQNDSESATMWKIHVPEGEGIAIKSTFGRLTQACDPYPRFIDEINTERPRYIVGKVKYIDYLKEPYTGYDPVLTTMRKSKFYQFEEEVRAILRLKYLEQRPTTSKNREELLSTINKNGGYEIQVDLEILIEDVFYLTKPGQTWFGEVVINLMNDMRDRNHIRSTLTPKKSKLHDAVEYLVESA